MHFSSYSDLMLYTDKMKERNATKDEKKRFVILNNYVDCSVSIIVLPKMNY